LGLDFAALKERLDNPNAKPEDFFGRPLTMTLLDLCEYADAVGLVPRLSFEGVDD